MHDIEPFYKWRQYYVTSEDEHSPFYGREYDEFKFTEKIYNYFIHPQWDNFGSATLYMKLLFVDYEESVAVIEFIGEWNDAIENDIMFIKREIADALMVKGIYKFILLCDNVLNFHYDDDSYYEEWCEDVSDEGGWVCLVNLHVHVQEEMEKINIQHYINFGSHLNDLDWRLDDPTNAVLKIKDKIENSQKQLSY